jgi:RNA recognition motif-containing protein
LLVVNDQLFKQDVQDLFEKQGAMITYIHMPVFPDSKRSRGFATVTFTKREYVTIALEMDGSKLKGGRWLQVAELDKSKLKKSSKKKKQAPAPSSEPNAAAPAEGTFSYIRHFL